MSAPAESAEAPALDVAEAAREPLLEEIEAFIAELTGVAAKARYVALRAEVERGRIEPGSGEALARLLEIVLTSGRVRRLHGPPVEEELLDLYHKTPRGEAVGRSAQAANRALAALAGHTLRRVSFTPRAPGSFRLAIHTDRCELALEVGPEGVRLESAGVSL